ncbi:MAG: glycosyltransferase family 4 protein [Acidobacteria bacterium]|nr:glycosyltransferase family 4 protein [Acidobacteriota bacterium]
MRIAQVAPLYESVPPRGYGGTERVVSYLTEELVRQGHEVTLFASGDSSTTARLVPVCKRSLRLDPGCIDQLAHHVVLLEEVYRRAAEFDLIHFHIDYLHFPVTRRQRSPNLTTLHGRLDIPDLAPLYREYRDMPVVSISNAQRRPLPWLDWRATVYHGLPADAFAFRAGAGGAGGAASTSGYLAFLGRVSPEKGLGAAIEIARRAGRHLRIAAKVDRADQEYFEREIQPQLRPPAVEFLGEVGGAEKLRLLAGADALLFPVDWPEPFGLVMIEALACGTPVIARGRGSVKEVMADPRSGFVCATTDEAVAAVGRLPELARRGCRQVFEDRFTAARMAADYLRVYRALLEEERDAVA